MAGSQTGVRRLSALNSVTLFRQAVFVPPGYSSLLFAHLYDANSCPRPTSLFRGFRQWLYSHADLHSPQQNQDKQATRVSIIRNGFMDFLPSPAGPDFQLISCLIRLAEEVRSAVKITSCYKVISH